MSVTVGNNERVVLKNIDSGATDFSWPAVSIVLL